jgi:hypothetical protein
VPARCPPHSDHFPLRYDDAENALVDLPIGYGYYYAPVTMLGIAGAQNDATRAESWMAGFSLPTHLLPIRVSLLGHDQYGNWAGGAGFTIRHGF